MFNKNLLKMYYKNLKNYVIIDIIMKEGKIWKELL